MPRLFIAVDLPEPVKARLADLCSGVPGAKWVKHDQIHLTLRFIGDADDAQTEAIKTALWTVKAASFEMRLESVGQFPPKGKPRVLWVGVTAPPALTGLHQRITTALAALGLPAEDYPFAPHITLARLKTPPAPEATRPFFARHAAFNTDPFPVESFVLYSSVLAPQGASYQREAIYPLAPSNT